MLPEVEAVVRGENNRCPVRQPHVLDRPQQEAQPGVPHGDLAAIGGVSLAERGFLVPRHIVPVAVQGKHQFAVVIRPVEFRVVGRGVPGFVGVPDVHLEKEVLFVMSL